MYSKYFLQKHLKMESVLSQLTKFILQVEKEYEKLPKKGSKKREIVIALMNTMMTEDEKTIFGPILEGLIDFSVGLMNQPKLLGVKSRFLCG